MFVFCGKAAEEAHAGWRETKVLSKWTAVSILHTSYFCGPRTYVQKKLDRQYGRYMAKPNAEGVCEFATENVERRLQEEGVARKAIQVHCGGKQACRSPASHPIGLNV